MDSASCTNTPNMLLVLFMLLLLLLVVVPVIFEVQAFTTTTSIAVGGVSSSSSSSTKGLYNSLFPYELFESSSIIKKTIILVHVRHHRRQKRSRRFGRGGGGGSRTMMSTTLKQQEQQKDYDSITTETTKIPTITIEIMEKMEATVKRYFQGVHEKNATMIRSCFDQTATIQDVCSIHSTGKIVPADVLVQRCIDFVTAHPDCIVQFHYGPICDRNGKWVVAHWYETGTWTNESCGISPTGTTTTTTTKSPTTMAVEGQTRFLVNPITYKIEQLIITRTYTEWEKQLLLVE